MAGSPWIERSLDEQESCKMKDDPGNSREGSIFRLARQTKLQIFTLQEHSLLAAII